MAWTTATPPRPHRLTFKELCGTGKKAIPFGEVLLDKATQYAAEDADNRRFKDAQAATGHRGRNAHLRARRSPAGPRGRANGAPRHKVDRTRLAKLSEEFATETARLEKEIHAIAGTEFTVGSPKQLGEVLFDTLGYKGGKKGKSGQYSTDQSVLERLSGEGAKRSARCSSGASWPS